MKKFSWILSLLLIVSLLLPFNSFAAAQPMKVFVDGNQITFNKEPFQSSGTTLVQFTPVFKALGLSVAWDAETKIVTGTKKDLIIKLTIGSKNATINGNKKVLTVAPKIVSGYTFVPLRFIGEASGSVVDWNKSTNSIYINKMNESLLINDGDSEDEDFLNYEQQAMNIEKSNNFPYFIENQGSDLKITINGYRFTESNILIDLSFINSTEMDMYMKLNLEKYFLIDDANIYRYADTSPYYSSIGTNIPKQNKVDFTILFENASVDNISDLILTGVFPIVNILEEERTFNIKFEKKLPKNTFTSATELQNYLEKHYSVIKTDSGNTRLKFIVDNSDINFWSDINIKAYYDRGFFLTMSHSSLKQVVKHMETLAKDAISRMPDKKISGSYYYTYYRYEYIKEDLQVTRLFSWSNHDVYSTYERMVHPEIFDLEIPIGDFRWLPKYDEGIF